MKILKRAADKEFLAQLSAHIGRISSIHTSAHHMGRLMRHFLRESKYVPKERETDYFICLLDTLIDLISGESYNSLFFFNGNDKSFITLKTPLIFPDLGLYWTGWIRLETGNIANKQCILSFLKADTNDVKGVEFFIQDRKLFYRLVKMSKGDSSTCISIPGVEIRENVWIHITMAHIGRELMTYVDSYFHVEDLGVQTYSKDYNIATIGACIDPFTNQAMNHFFGAMSALYFFKPIAKLKDTFKEIAQNGQNIELAYKSESILEENLLYFPEYSKCKGMKFMNQEFVQSTLIVVDPNVRSYII